MWTLQWKVGVFASALPTGPLPAIPWGLDGSGLSWNQPTHLGADGRIERYDKDSYDYHRLSRVAKVNMGGWSETHVLLLIQGQENPGSLPGLQLIRHGPSTYREDLVFRWPCPFRCAPSETGS